MKSSICVVAVVALILSPPCASAEEKKAEGGKTVTGNVSVTGQYTDIGGKIQLCAIGVVTQPTRSHDGVAHARTRRNAHYPGSDDRTHHVYLNHGCSRRCGRAGRRSDRWSSTRRIDRVPTGCHHPAARQHEGHDQQYGECTGVGPPQA